MPDVTIMTFNYILQWMGTGKIHLDITETGMKTTAEKKRLCAKTQLWHYLDFLTLADELLLCPRPEWKIVEAMEQIIREQLDSTADILFDGAMVHQAWLLPAVHPVRELFIKGSIMSYLYHVYNKRVYSAENPDTRRPFEFADELISVPGFAIDIAEYAAVFVAEDAIDAGPRVRSILPNAFRHPLTMKFMSVWEWGVEIEDEEVEW